jgi:hypothetical protein
MNEPVTYTTTDFYLACYLRAAGYPFAGITYDASGKRATFTFQSVREADILSYYNKRPESKVVALDLVSAIKQTRELLYNHPR